ncbi:MAG: LapA family protein [Burkholderiaceae bacterium]
MRLISWIFRIFLFLVALGFAVTNTTATDLHFFGMETVWRAPLVIFLLLFFAAGTVMGLLAVFPMLFRYRREIGRLRKELKLNAQPATPVPPSADMPASSMGIDPTAPTRLGV